MTIHFKEPRAWHYVQWKRWLPLLFLCLIISGISAKGRSTGIYSPATSQILQVYAPIAQVSNHADTSSHPSEKIIPGISNDVNRYPLYYLFLFIGGFVLLAIVRLLSPADLMELLKSSVNMKLLLYLFKEGRFGFTVTNVLLDALAIAMFGIFFQQLVFPGHYQLFPWVLAFTFLAYILKMIAVQLMSHVFMGRSEATTHLLMQMMFTRICGIIMLPLLFASFYQTFSPIQPLIIAIGWILVCFYGLWLIRLYVKMNSVSSSGLFYVFLYLCTIEISPLLILLKYFIHI